MQFDPGRYQRVARMNPRLKGWKAYANCIRSGWEYWLGAPRLRSRPLKLIFDPTNACQLACPLCPTGNGMVDRPKGHADLQLFRNLMAQVGDYVFMVDFYNWGDPMLSAQLEEFIQIASAHRVISTISSNFSLRLSDARIERLLASGVNEVIISVDGATRETHTRYRRRSDFDLILENMRRIVAARGRSGRSHPLITWQFVVFSFNEHEIERARAMAAEIGVDRIHFQPPFIQHERYELPEADRREIVHWAPRTQRYHTHIAPPPRRNRCGWHYTTVAINWDGTVTPCSTSFRKADDFGTVGKAGEHDYMTVVNNEAFQAARAFLAGGKPRGGLVCERCPTPSVQNYHRLVYRRIALLTAVALGEAMRRCWQTFRGTPSGEARAR